MYSVVGSAILAAGLDPHLGFLHVDGYNKPSFTFDMIEPFRPWVDLLLAMEAMKGQLKETYFTKDEGGYTLNKAGKRYLIPLFNDFMEERMRFRERLLSRKNHIFRFAGEFAQELLTSDSINPK